MIYHSPLTTLTILRVSRSHYRLLWSAVTLITNINGNAVLPRVVAVSGTIRKLQNAAIVYHRNVTARVLAVALDGKGMFNADTAKCSDALICRCVGSWRRDQEAGWRLGEGAGADKRAGGLRWLICLYDIHGLTKCHEFSICCTYCVFCLGRT